MIKERNVGVSVLLTIITFCIYGLLWFVCLAEDVNTATNKTDGTSGGMVLLFTILTCGIYGLYWLYKSGSAIDQMKHEQDLTAQNGYLGIVYLVLALLGLGIVAYALMQSELNQLARQQQSAK